MKMQFIQMWRATVLAAGLSLAAGCHAQSPAYPKAASTNAAAPDPLAFQPAPDVAQNMPTATEVEPAAPKPDLTLSPNFADAVKLVRAGVGENLLLNFIQNTTGTFGLGVQEIVYLNDLGASEAIINAMMDHDRTLASQRVAATAATEPAPATAVIPEAAPVTVNYFYNALTPYGNWFEVQGYGRCWQPTVIAYQPNWQPYCDRGNWIYTDYGWNWASDYSWGNWAFHYGRWFRHTQRGWCWAPDTVWAPAWVSWRSSTDYCGWAPLPPAAHYRPGLGLTYYDRNVSSGFDFGLDANCYTFVPTSHFNDRRPDRHFVPRHEVTHVFNQTRVNNDFAVGNNRHTVSNRGLAPETVAAATHTEIRPVHVRNSGFTPARSTETTPHFENRNKPSGGRTPSQPTTPLPQYNHNRTIPGSSSTLTAMAKVPPHTPHAPAAPVVAQHSGTPASPTADEKATRRQPVNPNMERSRDFSPTDNRSLQPASRTPASEPAKFPLPGTPAAAAPAAERHLAAPARTASRMDESPASRQAANNFTEQKLSPAVPVNNRSRQSFNSATAPQPAHGNGTPHHARNVSLPNPSPMVIQAPVAQPTPVRSQPAISAPAARAMEPPHFQAPAPPGPQRPALHAAAPATVPKVTRHSAENHQTVASAPATIASPAPDRGSFNPAANGKRNNRNP